MSPNVKTLLSACLLLAPLPAFAQAAPDIGIEESTRGLLALQALTVERRASELRKSSCDRNGCLFIANETQSYDTIDIKFDTRMPGASGDPKWGPDSLRGEISPRSTLALPKVGDDTTCAVPVMVVIRNRKTHEKKTLTAVTSLCRSPGLDSVLRINVVEPRITVEGEAK